MKALRRARRRGLVAGLALIAAASATLVDRGGAKVRVARAATALPKGVALQASVDRTEVGVGELVGYTIKVVTTVSGLRASVATTGKTPGFVVVGGPFTGVNSFSSQQGFGGPITERTELSTTYQLRAKDLGEHVLGPGQMQIGGVSYDAPSVKIKVVSRPTAPIPGLRGRLPPPPPLDDDPEDSPVPDRFEPVDPAAKLDAPPTGPAERQVFARMVVEPKAPVVGQAVVVKTFVYARVPISLDPPQARSYPDFAAIPLTDYDKQPHPITLAEETWKYLQVQGTAAFPLRTGALTIGAVSIDIAHGLRAEQILAPALSVDVKEPPAEGRPADYVLGDVASGLGVSSELSPRESADGHAVLTVRLSGEGRLDNLDPKLPSAAGVAFTRTSDDVKASVHRGRVLGRRTLVYDVAATRAGELPLGEVRAVVWDPNKSSYVTIGSPLGALKAKVAAPAPAASTSAEPRLELPPPRSEPGARGDGATIADRAWTWGVVATAPLLVLATQGLARMAGSLRRRGAARREDPLVKVKGALKAARTADRAGDAKGAAAACVRALELALEAATDGAVRARGMTTSELEARLSDEGMEPPLAARVTEATSALQAARFAGERGPETEQIEALVRAIGAFGATRAALQAEPEPPTRGRRGR